MNTKRRTKTKRWRFAALVIVITGVLVAITLLDPGKKQITDPPGVETIDPEQLRIKSITPYHEGSSTEFIVQLTGEWWSAPYVMLETSLDKENWQSVGVIETIGSMFYVRDEPAAFFKERYYRVAATTPW